MSNFDEAREQSMELFNNNGELPAEEVADVPVEESSEGVSEPIDETDTPAENVEEPAEVPEEVLEENIPAENIPDNNRDNQLEMENAQLRMQLQNAENIIQQMSQQREEDVIEDSTQPQFNTADMSGLLFGGEEAQKQAQTELAENILKYVMQNLDGKMKSIQPFVDEARRGQAERERRTAIDNLSRDELMSGIGEAADRLDVIIKANPQMFPSSMSAEDKYTAAYALMIGANTLKNPPKPPADPTTDELMNIYRNNPDFRDAIERERLEAIKSNQQVPVFSASNGVGNAAPTINEKPKTMADASSATRKMFQGL